VSISVPLDLDIGQALFDDLLERFVRPEVTRRLDSGRLSVGAPIYRFQVLLHDDSQDEIRLNEEVGGIVDVEPAERVTVAEGDEVSSGQVAAITRYEPRPDDAGVPHLTALSHRGRWSLVFDLGGGHTRRHDFLDRAAEFLATARDAAASGRTGAFLENAFDACELLAKAELLSSRPTMELVVASSTHKAIARPYHAWAKLGNTEARFAQLLARLTELRGAARYPDRELVIEPTLVEEMLETLAAMERHVTDVVEGSEHVGLRTETLIAKRPLPAGRLVTNDDVTIYPLKQPKPPQPN
jgi:hypothetical protein